MASPRIAMVGLGYVGLCTGVCLASAGFEVVGVDTSPRIVEAISRGEPPLFEPGVGERLKRAISEQRFSCSTSIEAASGSEYFFLTVGTPSRPDGGIDLTQVRSAARSVGRLLRGATSFPLVVVRSTVIPGTAEKTVKPILERESGLTCGRGFGLCSNPEFLREGSAIEDTLHPDKVVIGAGDERSRKRLLDLYGAFFREKSPSIVSTGLSSAELIKYANNAFLAMKISYINSIARLCEGMAGADVKAIAEAIGLDSRIGPKFLEAGPGYGGSCFPKDVQALISFAKKVGAEHSLFSATEEVNRSQAEHVVNIALSLLGSARGKSVSVLGLSFKAGTDDVRQSPSIRVIERLLSLKARVRVYDPRATENTRGIFGERLQYAQSAEECLKNSDLSIVMTGWEEFTKLRPDDFSRLMKRPRVVDARRIYDPREFARIQFAAVGLGQ